MFFCAALICRATTAKRCWTRKMEAFTAPGISTLYVWYETKRYHTCMSMTTTTPAGHLFFQACKWTKLKCTISRSGRSWLVQVPLCPVNLLRFDYFTCHQMFLMCFIRSAACEMLLLALVAHGMLLCLWSIDFFNSTKFVSARVLLHSSHHHILPCRTMILQKPPYFCHV